MKTLTTKLLGLILLVGLSMNLQAQGVSQPITKYITNTTELEKAEITTDAVDQLSAYLAKNIEYPQDLRAIGVEGKSLVKVTIDKKGKIVSKKIIKSLGKQFDNSIMESLGKITKLSPVYVNGVAESYSIVVPIKYKK